LAVDQEAHVARAKLVRQPDQPAGNLSRKMLQITLHGCDSRWPAFPSRISRIPWGISTGSIWWSPNTRQQQATIRPVAMLSPSLVNSKPYVTDFSPILSTVTLISTIS